MSRMAFDLITDGAPLAASEVFAVSGPRHSQAAMQFYAGDLRGGREFPGRNEPALPRMYATEGRTTLHVGSRRSVLAPQ